MPALQSTKRFPAHSARPDTSMLSSVLMFRNVLLIALLLAAPCLAAAKDKSKDRFLQPGPIHIDKAGEKWVDKTLRKMSSEEKVGQLFGIRVNAQFLNEADPIWIQLRDT